MSHSALQNNGRAAFAWSVLDGLSQPQKCLSSTWLYDADGSLLFERITELPEYYLTRTEISLLENHAGDIAATVGREAVVVEIGSGSSRKTPLLLGRLEAPRAYVPVDIAAHCLDESTGWLAQRFPALPMHPLVADFNEDFRLPAELRHVDGPRLGFFPGSTIGNLGREAARAFLRRMRGVLGQDGWMVVGVDPTRDPARLIPAYDDAAGVTAEFNLNLLARINRELGANFNLSAFRHEARFNADEGRVEMHLVSEFAQSVRLLGKTFRFNGGETIHTENSHKYPQEEFEVLAHTAGWQPVHCWSDPDGCFTLHVLRPSRLEVTAA